MSQRMASPMNSVLAAAATTMVLLSLASGDSAKDKEECTQQLIGLAPCLPYVEGHAKAPTPDCCVGLNGVLTTHKKCLCLLIKDRNDPDLGLNINVTLALTLPSRCNSQTSANVSKCPELLGLNPKSPEAQVFYQLGNNSTAHSPAQAPASVASVLGPGPVAGGNQSSNSCGSVKRPFGWEILAGGALIWCFITSSRYNYYMIMPGWAI